MDADAQVEAARAAGARTAAPYEFTEAEIYLREAREADGRARYDESARLAAQATALARQALARTPAPAAKGQGKP